MSRVIAFLYGLAAYVLFLGTAFYAVASLSGLEVPMARHSAMPAAEALAVDLLLILVFAVQHSVMARRRFKQWWTKFIPVSVERSTYVLFASLALVLLVWQWRPVAIDVWRIDNPQLAMAVLGLSLVGWLIALTGTFLINHFELFGLLQVASNLAGRPMPAPRLRTPLLYKMVRHPIYLGFIIAFWAAPTMTVDRLLFAAVITAYMFVGIFLEERDLVKLFGEQYRSYRERVPMLFPWRKSV